MLRKTLLATTALVLGASLAYAGQKGVMPKNSKLQAKMLSHAAHVVNHAPVIVQTSQRGSHPAHNNPPNLAVATFTNYAKYANGQFISWYGYTAANESSCYTSGAYYSCFSFVGDNALSFTPAATVTTKKVTVPLFSFYSTADYAVNIYSSSGGLPGAVLATSKTFSDSDTSLCCTASRTVAIKAKLTGGTQYFLGVVGTQQSGNAYGGWDMEEKVQDGSVSDYWHYNEKLRYGYTTTTGYNKAYSSPWHASTYIPTTGAVILK